MAKWIIELKTGRKDTIEASYFMDDTGTYDRRPTPTYEFFDKIEHTEKRVKATWKKDHPEAVMQNGVPVFEDYKWTTEERVAAYAREEVLRIIRADKEANGAGND